MVNSAFFDIEEKQKAETRDRSHRDGDSRTGPALGHPARMRTWTWSSLGRFVDVPFQQGLEPLAEGRSCQSIHIKGWD